MRKKTIILTGFIILKFILQYLLISPIYDLQRDEYLHLDQAKHLAWGYESVPPFTSWISWIILQLGNSEFWVKFFPALFGALTLLIVWKMVEELKGNLFALILTACAITFSAILRINILYQPNSFEILSWTLLYFSLLKHINTGNGKWLLMAGFILGLGFLNKYNIVFLAAGLFPALLMSAQRKLLLRKHFYFALLIAFIIVLPDLIWQYRNNFPVFHHLKELADTQLANVSRRSFLKGQISFFFSSFFVLLAGFISFFTVHPFKKYRFFLWGYLITIILFTYLRAKAYYAIGLYPVFIAFGSVYLESLLSKGRLRHLRYVSIIFIVVLFLLPVRIIFPVLSPEQIVQKNKFFKMMGVLHWEDGKEHALPQDFADMLGWKELAMKTDSLYKTIPDKQHTLILCDNYGEAGAINYYSRYGLQAVSMNADYINWFPLNKMEIRNVILVQEASDDDPLHKKEASLFETIALISKIENKYAREYGTSICLLSHAKTDINNLLRQEIYKKKKNY